MTKRRRVVANGFPRRFVTFDYAFHKIIAIQNQSFPFTIEGDEGTFQQRVKNRVQYNNRRWFY